LDLADQYRRVLASGPGFTVWDVTRDVVETAASLRATYRLKMLDALHLASAIVHGAQVFLSSDEDLRRVSGIKVLVLGDFVGLGPP
jgi:predicted nucleic acid-binding protein